MGIGYWIILGVFAIIGWIVSNRLKGKFQHYSQMGTRSGKSGREVAEHMLSFYGIRDVQVVMGQGFLTDTTIRPIKLYLFHRMYMKGAA